jgi:hypothetical protein
VEQPVRGNAICSASLKEGAVNGPSRPAYNRMNGLLTVAMTRRYGILKSICEHFSIPSLLAVRRPRMSEPPVMVGSLTRFPYPDTAGLTILLLDAL